MHTYGNSNDSCDSCWYFKSQRKERSVSASIRIQSGKGN